MGGDIFSPPLSSTEEKSSLDPDFPQSFSISSGDDDYEGLSHHNWGKSSAVSGESGLSSVESQDLSPCSPKNDAVEKLRLKVYTEVLKSYEDLQCRLDRLDEAKNNILSYKPSSWAKKASGMGSNEYNVPNKTSLLLIGPKGSGKSSLVNKISRVLEDNVFLSERAQVSYNSTGDGTYFVRGYTIPSGSGSFCLYDTRSLSIDLSENLKMLKRWMTKGVRHGELVKRKSDSKDLKAQLRCNVRRNCPSSQFTAINYVIFIVNGLSVLESMDSVEGKKKNYCEMIAANFKSPLLSFKDDRPAVVVTHGDLLSLSDRVRVRMYLGELLGVPPTRQIFDIPENNDSATRLAIVDMLTYCLERADWNLPTKKRESFVGKVYYFVACLLVLSIAIVLGILGFHISQPPAPPPIKVVPFSAGQPPTLPPTKGVHVAPPAKKRVPISTGQAPAPPPIKVVPFSTGQTLTPPPRKKVHADPPAKKRVPISTGQAPAPPPLKVVPLIAGHPPTPPPRKGVHVAPPAKKRVPINTGQPPAEMKIEWDKIRCMWLGDDNY